MGARFVRLGIAGFKSFADATTLEILPGLTGVVGPNGCGKSNVAEALRWAMGEANARHLRGGEMDDVIFAGTAHRPSRNLAEVTLTVEEEGGLPPPFAGQAELHVARRIERGTGSAYRVNGREARARDVQTLFADLASGARSSAMVSQGRVGALVNARPEERRGVLEEAAGITGLHARRAEAETRLRGTEANLERAEERRVLLERQGAGLHEQAREAARYRAVSAALGEAEATLLAIGRVRARLGLAAAETAAAAAVAEVGRAGAAAAEAAAAAERLNAALPALREAERAAQVAADRARAAAEGLAAEAAGAKAALAAAQGRRAQLASDVAHAERVLGEAEGVDARLVAEAAELTQAVAAHPALLEAARAEAEAATAALTAADAAAAAAASEAARAGAEAGARQQILAAAEARFRRAEEGMGRLRAERAAAAAKLVEPARVAAAAAAWEAARGALAAARAALDEAERERPRATAAAAAARDAHGRAEAARHKLAAEVSALTEVLAVKDGERWPAMLDSLAVAPGFEGALGAALGEELAAAANPAAARHWRELPAVPTAAAPGRSLAGVVTGPGLLARALSAVGIVESEAEGVAAQAALGPGQSVVSADGGLWRWDGYTVRPRTPSAAAVRLQQRNRLAELKVRLAAAVAAAAEARAAKEAADGAEREATRREGAARGAGREAEAAAERARSAHTALSGQAEAAGARVAALDGQLRDGQPEAEAAAAALEAARREMAALPDTATLRRVAEATRAAVGAARQRDVAAGRALDAVGRMQAARVARLGVIGREREDRRMRVADLAGRAVDLRARAAEAERELAALGRAPEEAARRAEAAGAAVAEADGALRRAQAERTRGEAGAAEAAGAARTGEAAVYAAREAAVRAEAGLEAARLRLEEAEARVAERAGALPPLPEQPETSGAAEDRARTRMGRLARERDEIGPVNLRAEAEVAAVDAEVATITRERDELGTAVAKLRGSIGHLNREGRERLQAVFEQVDRQFQALFSRLFGGGRAYLALVGSDDPLQAGLEIYAQPPGKKLTALSLLSGGEQALTALSLVFAVFRCNPAPLCVLDEVDAPLDDANVGRFCALLSDMAVETGTRFLVVTHHQVTMAGMDRLYGVTMQERGVSRLLSVDLSQAAAFREAIAAE